MGTLILRRAFQALPTLLAAVTLVWFLVFMLPGDPVRALLGPTARPEQVEAIRHHWGLDRPVPVQYAIYMKRLLTGDMGESMVKRRPVAEILAEGLPRSLLLGGAAMLIAIPGGILLGVAAARGGRLSRIVMGAVSLAGLSIPTFWMGHILILIFAVRLGLLPISGYGTPAEIVLPALTLAFYPAALVARVTRAAFAEQLNARHVTAARARGLESRSIVWRHAFRNALAPIVTVSGLLSATLVGGAVATETVFGWPGLGRILWEAAYGSDVMLVEGGVILLTGMIIVANLGVDLAYAAIDPRTRRWSRVSSAR